MAKSRKQLREEVKAQYMEKLISFFQESEEVLRVGSNEIAFPVVDSEGNEDFIVLTCKIPTGANKGTEPYDGYAMAEDYEMKLKDKAEKAQKAAEAKAKKIEKDKKYREKLKEQKEKREEKEQKILPEKGKDGNILSFHLHHPQTLYV